MPLTNRNGRRAAVLLSALIGAAAFILIYGYRVIIPTYTDWLMYGAGDPQQHYLGWRFFQQSSWQIPIGMMDNLGHPIMTSVVFTDSIPLFAVLFKLLTPILPADFQYFGIWGILCFMLQGALGAYICLKHARTPIQAVLGSVLFILSPPILHRMYYHSALAGHWIILLGLAFVVYHQSLSSRPVLSFILWGLLGGLIASIHLYFLPMCGILCLGYCVYDIVRNRRWYGFLPIISFVAATLGVSWVLGVFTGATSASSAGLGDYSFNLNGFFNPQWPAYSTILQPLSTASDLQHEGFAYLGFGVLLLAMLSALLQLDGSMTRRALGDAARRRRLDIIIYGIMAALYVFVAMSPVVTFGKHVLFTIPLPEALLNLWAIFRSTGRLIWPLGYIIIFISIALLTKKQEKRFAVILLACCVGLQGYDLSHRMRDLNSEYSERVEYTNPLTEDFWHGLCEDGVIRHLIVDESRGDFAHPFADIAIQNHWTLNDFYFARNVDGIWNTLPDSLKAPDDSMLFAMKPETFENMQAYADMSIRFYEIDGLIVGTTRSDLIDLPELERVRHYSYPIGEGEYLRGGEDVDGVRYVQPDGLSYGPYWYLAPGIYEIHMTGTNLDKADVVCATNAANTLLDSYDYRAAPGELSFKIQLFEATENIEVLVSAAGGETISFGELTASYLSDNQEILADDSMRSYRPFAYQYVFADDINLSGGEDRNGSRYLYEGGLSYGPYLSLPAGTYEIHITGANLDLAELDSVAGRGVTSLTLEDLRVAGTAASFRLELTAHTEDLEIRVHNISPTPIMLTSLTIESVAPDTARP